MSFNVVLLDRKRFPCLIMKALREKGLGSPPVRFWLEAGQATQS